MTRHLLPRPWREVGKRGQILLTYGVLWVLIGVGTMTEPAPPAWTVIPLLAAFPLGPAWVVTGLIAIAYAWRPRIIGHDGVAFLALYVMPAYRAGAYILGWVDSLIDGVGGPGYPRGWLTSLTYLAMVAAVMICASWPEPPHHHTEGRR